MLQLLNFVSIVITAVVLLYFRRHQREINIRIDEFLLTPADYTIHVKNIPLG